MMKFTQAALLATAIALPQAALAAPSAVGGSTQVSAQSGCMNQWMFNSVWRVRVTKVAFHPTDPDYGANAWEVTMQWNNGTKYEGITPSDTLKNDMQLALANGDTIAATETTHGNLNQQQLDFHSFPASGQFTYTQKFYSNNTLDPNNKPARLLITFDVAKYRSFHLAGGGKFWNQRSPGYNYRISLTCTR